MKIVDLIQCGQLCKRIRSISHDESLWQKMNLFRRPVPTEFVQLIINNGCKYLSFYNATIQGTAITVKSSQLRYLDLSNCNIDSIVLQKLLFSCHLLEKLSLYDLEVTSKLVSRICLQNGQSLKVLVLSQCKGLDLESVQHIVKNCVELTEINLDCTYLPKDAIDFLVNNPMTKVARK